MRWVRRYADRLVAVHAKDIAADGPRRGEDGWCALGKASSVGTRCCRRCVDTVSCSSSSTTTRANTRRHYRPALQLNALAP